MFFHNKLSYRKGVDSSRTNILYINVGKTNEMVEDFKKRGYTLLPQYSDCREGLYPQIGGHTSTVT